MFSILKRALSWAITSFGNKFCLKKRSRFIKALDNRFYVKFMQLEIGLFSLYIAENKTLYFVFNRFDEDLFKLISNKCRMVCKVDGNLQLDSRDWSIL